MSVNDVRSPAVPVTASAVRKIKVMLDRPRTLRYDLNALALLEERYGDLDKALNAFNTGSPRALRFLLYAGLVHEDGDLTEAGAGALFAMADIRDLGQAINEAVRTGLPESDPNVQDPPETADPEGSTGPGSTTPPG